MPSTSKRNQEQISSSSDDGVSDQENQAPNESPNDEESRREVESSQEGDVNSKLSKLSISEKKNEEEKSTGHQPKKNQNKDEDGDDSEEVIDTGSTPKRNNRNKKRGNAKKLQPEYMNSEKERYLSRLHNIADLISSSSSSEDDSDGDFSLNEIDPESDSASGSSRASFKNSSQYTESSAPSYDDGESSIGVNSSGKKSIISAVSSYNSKRKI
ncbi:unnamed protein product [Moneuplotes crassus]|uniref:Uncharacterized protein n=1 Tax=Euplotes crassus TaxID=5936 RepID=A0AAD2CXF5_EUPCR|nr:unnamed protein product [Moneuplotes crassus]